MINYNEFFEHKTFKIISEWVEVIIVAFILALVVKSFIVETARISGGSMQPTFFENEKVFVNKLAYVLDTPKRGDIVAIDIEEKKKEYIKRVVALPGEKIDICDGNVYINDLILKEDYTKGNTYAGANHIKFPYVLEEDEYFVLGDNRMHSEDSRSLSLEKITKKKIRGKVFFRCYPFNKIELIENEKC